MLVDTGGHGAAMLARTGRTAWMAAPGPGDKQIDDSADLRLSKPAISRHVSLVFPRPQGTVLGLH